MKRIYYFIFPAVLISCGGTEKETTQDQENSIETTEPVSLDQNTILEEFTNDYVPENKDGKWQIDDYAEIMLGSKVYASSDQVPEEERLSANWFEKLDLQGGFASVSGAYEGWSEVVLWRMKDGSDLVAKMTAGCGPVCDYSYSFSILKDGEMIERDASDLVLPLGDIMNQREIVLNKILSNYSDVPEDTYAQVRYMLPQKGTTMYVDLELGEEEIRTHLLKLSWDKEMFNVEETFEDAENIMYK
ncbi:MAG: hypothetical protein R2780_05030 [Crocinitomicaceae bacterium]